MTRSAQDLLPGSVDMLVLHCLNLKERHGFDVSQWVREHTEGVLTTPDGALYKALHRLEERRCLSSRWGRSVNGRKAKYYRITELGRAALRDEREAWSAFAAAVAQALAAES